MVTDEYVVILERLDGLQKSADRLDKDLATDREDLQEFRVRLGAMEGEVNALRKGLGHQADKVQEQVSDVVQPLMDQIEDKKIIEYHTESFWKKLMFWKT